LQGKEQQGAKAEHQIQRCHIDKKEKMLFEGHQSTVIARLKLAGLSGLGWGRLLPLLYLGCHVAPEPLASLQVFNVGREERSSGTGQQSYNVSRQGN
jgi:hypothetical protein